MEWNAVCGSSPGAIEPPPAVRCAYRPSGDNFLSRRWFIRRMVSAKGTPCGLFISSNTEGHYPFLFRRLRRNQNIAHTTNPSNSVICVVRIRYHPGSLYFQEVCYNPAITK